MLFANDVVQKGREVSVIAAPAEASRGGERICLDLNSRESSEVILFGVSAVIYGAHKKIFDR